MKKYAICIGGLLLSASVVAAQSIPKLEAPGPGGSTVRLEVSERLRGEFVDYFETAKNRYDFLGNRFQLGARLTSERIEAFVQLQHSLLEDLPDGGPGTGGNYYSNTHKTFQQEPILRAGWMRAKFGSAQQRITVTVGRQAFRDGLESPAVDPTLKWIQAQRIAERLIGPFDFTHIGRSFDGAQVAYDNDLLNATAFGFVPTDGGFEISANRNMENIHLAGIAITGKEARHGGALPRIFWIDYTDNREITVTDNRPQAVRGADSQNIHVFTVGGDVAYARKLGPGKADVLLWLAGQWGDWQSQNQRAYAFAAEAGYAFSVWGTPWLRAGINRGSGDSDAADGRHETFFQMIPTPRIYAMFPFYNMMNNQDVFVQLLLKPHERVSLRADGHWLRLADSEDLFYAGGGATKSDNFGFSGQSSAGRDELAYVTEFTATIAATENLSVQMYYAHAFGQGVIGQRYASKSANYGFLETTLAF